MIWSDNKTDEKRLLSCLPLNPFKPEFSFVLIFINYNKPQFLTCIALDEVDLKWVTNEKKSSLLKQFQEKPLGFRKSSRSSEIQHYALTQREGSKGKRDKEGHEGDGIPFNIHLCASPRTDGQSAILTTPPSTCLTASLSSHPLVEYWGNVSDVAPIFHQRRASVVFAWQSEP